MPVAAETGGEAVRIGAEVFQALKMKLSEAGYGTNVGDEGRIRAVHRRRRRSHRIRDESDRGGGLRPGRGRVSGARRGGDRILRRRQVCSRRRGPDPRRRRYGRDVRGPCRRYPHRVHRGRDGGRRLARLGGLDERHRGTACSSSATTCSSRTGSAWREGVRRGAANAILIKANQIGTLTETLENGRGRAPVRLPGHRVPSVGRDGGHDHRGSGGGHELRPDQDGIPSPDPTGWPSNNQLIRIEERLGRSATFAGRGVLM